MKRLEGKVAIITGSGKGVGRAFALGMAKEGAHIVVNSTSSSAEKVVEEIKSLGGKAVSFVGKIGQKDVAERLVETALSAFGKLDILINNAGITNTAPFLEMTREQWEETLSVDLTGAFFCSQISARYMVENKVKGRIIYVTSEAGIDGLSRFAAYSAAKAGVIGLMKSNSRELARYGICVNAVAPLAKTETTEDPLRAQVMDDHWKNMISQNTIGRIGTSEDCVPAVIFLSSEDSYYVTGQTIELRGTLVRSF